MNIKRLLTTTATIGAFLGIGLLTQAGPAMAVLESDRNIKDRITPVSW